MSKPNDGGPAFPNMGGALRGGDGTENGLSLRDYFAGQVIVGLMSAMATVRSTTRDRNKLLKDTAGTAYDIADAMIAERNKEPTHD